VAEAQARVDSREFAEWMAIFKLSPWGEERTELSRGQLTAIVANFMSAAGADDRRPDDYVLKFDALEEDEEPTQEEIDENAARIWAKLERAIGGKQ